MCGHREYPLPAKDEKEMITRSGAFIHGLRVATTALPSEEIIEMVLRMYGPTYNDHQLMLCIMTWLDGQVINAKP